MRFLFNIQPRYILFISGIIALIMIFGGIYRSQESRNEIYHVLQEEAFSLVETIDRASTNIILSSDEIEHQIADRLLTAGRFIAQIDSLGDLQTDKLRRIAAENNIYHIDVINRSGRRILSNQSLNPSENALTQSGDVQKLLKPLLQGKEDHVVIGIIQTPSGSKEQFVVAVRRITRNGGVIILNTDISEFSELKKNIGIGKLIRDLGNNSGIEYTALQDPDGIIAASDSVDQLSSFSDDSTLVLLWNTDTTVTRQTTFHNREVFETLRTFSMREERVGIIRIGLSMDEVKAIERQSERRNIMRSVILFFVALLTITALIANQNFRLSRQRIQAMETFTGTILERMQDAVITLDVDQKISIFNKQAEELFGVKASTVLDKPFSDIAREKLGCLNEIFSSDTFQKDMNLLIPDKTERIVSVAITRSDKNITAVIRDLTETKRLQQEIERREKLSAMGELAAGVAHEIRNPLNAISMIAQRYEKEFKPARGVKEYTVITSVLLKEARRVNNIIQQFLRFTRPPKLNIQPISISEFLSHTATLFKSGAKSQGVNFSLETSCEGVLNIDQEQIIQALHNILRNALEATPKGGSIHLSCSKHNLDIQIIITDTGHGIPKNQLSKIFNLYYTTKPSGTGLGLAITQQIIQQHNGSIRVESEERKGTRFTVVLPSSSH